MCKRLLVSTRERKKKLGKKEGTDVIGIRKRFVRLADTLECLMRIRIIGVLQLTSDSIPLALGHSVNGPCPAQRRRCMSAETIGQV